MEDEEDEEVFIKQTARGKSRWRTGDQKGKEEKAPKGQKAGAKAVESGRANMQVRSVPKAVAVCGTYGCTLPDKHRGLHAIPDTGPGHSSRADTGSGNSSRGKTRPNIGRTEGVQRGAAKRGVENPEEPKVCNVYA